MEVEGSSRGRLGRGLCLHQSVASAWARRDNPGAAGPTGQLPHLWL